VSTATVTAASTVEPSASTAVKATATAVEAATTRESATSASEVTATANAATSGETTVTGKPSSTESSATEAASAESPTTEATVKAASAEATAEPRAGADEEATGEPFRPIEAIRRAVIRVIPVVTVSTDRGTIAIAVVRPNADLDLGLRRSRRGKQENTKQSQIPEIP
jgi:hypothetical protein